MAGIFELQAGWCRKLGSEFTAQLLERAEQSFGADGPVASLTRDWPGDSVRDAIALRLAGALHAGVLSGRDGKLASLYPARGFDWRMEDVWPAAEAFLERETEWVRAFMMSPPQTNEVGRSGVLAPAFLWLADRSGSPFHMLELGASAGLNMNWDRFRYAHQGWDRNDGAGPLIPTRIDGDAPGWRDIDIASRAACDQSPLDPGDENDRLRLNAYIWPDQFDRLDRLNAAIEIAAAAPWRVEKADASEWIAEKLSKGLPVGTSVIYHSIFLQYPPASTQRAIAAAIEAAGSNASRDRQLAWVRFEPEAVIGGPLDSDRMVVSVVRWYGRGRSEAELCAADPHGHRCRWLNADA